jgi:hypothetical protein
VGVADLRRSQDARATGDLKGVHDRPPRRREVGAVASRPRD